MIIPEGLFIAVVAYEYPSDNTKMLIIRLLLLCSVLIIQFVTSLIALVGIKLITESIVEDKPMSLSAAIKLAFSKLGRAITTQFVTSLIIFGLSLLLFIPGLIYSVFYMFTLDAVALREKTGKEARNLQRGAC